MILENFDNFNSYSKKYLESDFNSVYGCPECGFTGMLHRHGNYLRNLMEINENFNVCINSVGILRVFCPKCGTTHAVIPDFIIPYKQVSFNLIMKIIEMFFLESYSKLQIESSLVTVSRQLVKNIIIAFLLTFNYLFMFFKSNAQLLNFDSMGNVSPKDFVLALNSYLTLGLHFSKDYFNSTNTVFMMSKKPFKSVNDKITQINITKSVLIKYTE